MATVIFALIGTGALGFMLVFLAALCKEGRRTGRSIAAFLIHNEPHEAELLPDAAASRHLAAVAWNDKQSAARSSLNELFTKALGEFYDRTYPMLKGSLSPHGRPSAGK